MSSECIVGARRDEGWLVGCYYDGFESRPHLNATALLHYCMKVIVVEWIIKSTFQWVVRQKEDGERKQLDSDETRLMIIIILRKWDYSHIHHASLTSKF